MSLDVYLKSPEMTGPERWTIFIRENGANREISLEDWNKRFPGKRPVLCHVGGDETVYTANITHNLGLMANEAWIYEVIWRPEDLEISVASQLIEPLRRGLDELKANPDKYKLSNPSNGWGNYDDLVDFVEKYIVACEENPAASVSVWR